MIRGRSRGPDRALPLLALVVLILASPAAAADTQRPSAPSNLRAAAVSSVRITLSWTASTDNVGVTGYRVERCRGRTCTSFVQVAVVAGTQTSYADARLAASTSYRYRVRAGDAAGNLSRYSNIAGATTRADAQAPSAPGTLTATAQGASQIDLSWRAATDSVGIAGYRVERCQGAGCTHFVQIAAPAGTGTTYRDTSLTASTTFRYRVRASDGTNLGPYSNVAGATTAAGVPGLVAAYGFSEGSGSTVADASGRGNTGTLAGATWAAAGKYGPALTFDGASARVTVPDAAALRLTTGMTLEAWVKPAVVNPAWRDVIYKGNDNYYLEATSSNAGLPAGGGTFGGTGVWVNPAVTAPVNTWTHLAVTYDGAALRFYVNGVLSGTGVQSGAIATSASPLELGGDSIFGQFFQGLIDEVRVYNAPLTREQIQVDMNTPIAPATPDTEPPGAPGTLAAAAQNGGQVNLFWGAATDNVGVTGYSIERCAGGGCASFAPVGATLGTGTTFADTGLTSGTLYRYRVQATDAAGNLGAYSNVAEATPSFSISPRHAALTFTQTQPFTAGAGQLTWAVDGLVGGSAAVGTITPEGLYTPPASVGTHTVTATLPDQTQSLPATVYITNYAGKFTHGNDNQRTGQNLGETVLSPANVGPATFGKLFAYALDGNAYASPLYVANVTLPGQGVHNVVYVATEHNSVYALDADGLSPTPLWQVSFINPAAGITPVPAQDTGGPTDITPEIGITGTPVIDPATGTLYVVAKTKEVVGSTTSYVQRLHALDLGTGQERFGGPVVLAASVPGIGAGAQGGQLAFNALMENQRPALLLANGVVYIAFGSHEDVAPYHGWLLGYDASTLQPVFVFCVTPNGAGGGIWQGGGGPAVDAAGALYVGTSNGTFSVNTGGFDYGDSFLKLDPSGTVLDFFTPHDQATLDTGNLDLGSGGTLLLPDQPGAHPHLLVAANKDGTIYLVDRDNMGHYNPNNDSQIVQSFANIFANPGNFASPVYFNGAVYFAPINDAVKAFALSNGLLSAGPTSQTAEIYGFPGATMALSANGTSDAILWTVQRKGTGSPGVLRAYAAGNLTTLLYSSEQAGSRDTLDIAVKFGVPAVANGKVFVPSLSQLTVYGLLP